MHVSKPEIKKNNFKGMSRVLKVLLISRTFKLSIFVNLYGRYSFIFLKNLGILDVLTQIEINDYR